MLSEKAKGKQRAIDPTPDLVEGQTSDAPAESKDRPRDLVIRFTEGSPDLTISVNKSDFVRDVKHRIRASRPELQNRRLRFIHSGRLLTDGTLLHSWLVSLEERQQRAKHDDVASHEILKWIHCSVGPVIDSKEQEAEDRPLQPQIQPVRGFDRLASIGFSPEDIENFRRQFHSQSSSDYLDSRDFETEEEYDEHARALEEQWIDSLDNAGSATLSQSSTSSTSVLQGIVTGFFFPILPLFFMQSQKPPVFWEDGQEHEPTPNVIFS
ncbi:hypothetical protein CVT24_006161 [Panaeolus cyanescens]|uniref:Ubiquitin-like domain-containing protein n=1 Tax=Panaeolus cyanescens TaxID=181874 RepID=A0A409V8N3_9AGAR|nr:hypothetical protein CVT24_006161 [Panaeolus cyanescens]